MRVKKILKSQLSGGNAIKTMNTWAIPVIRYTARIVNLTQRQRKAQDRTTRKIMTLKQDLHPHSSVDTRKIGGCGILQVHWTVEEEMALEEYLKASEEDPLKIHLYTS